MSLFLFRRRLGSKPEKLSSLSSSSMFEILTDATKGMSRNTALLPRKATGDSSGRCHPMRFELYTQRRVLHDSWSAREHRNPGIYDFHQIGDHK